MYAADAILAAFRSRLLVRRTHTLVVTKATNKLTPINNFIWPDHRRLITTVCTSELMAQAQVTCNTHTYYCCCRNQTGLTALHLNTWSASSQPQRCAIHKCLETGENEKNTHKCNFMLDYNEIREQIKWRKIDSLMRYILLFMVLEKKEQQQQQNNT